MNPQSAIWRKRHLSDQVLLFYSKVAPVQQKGGGSAQIISVVKKTV